MGFSGCLPAFPIPSLAVARAPTGLPLSTTGESCQLDAHHRSSLARSSHPQSISDHLALSWLGPAVITRVGLAGTGVHKHCENVNFYQPY